MMENEITGNITVQMIFDAKNRIDCSGDWAQTVLAKADPKDIAFVEAIRSLDIPLPEQERRLGIRS